MPRSRPSPAPAGQAAGQTPAPPIVSRQEIKTVPGGGLNRISDGRAAAAAYVGVSALQESAKRAPPTFSPVKLAQDLLVENKEFRTEPALRGQSFPPPVPSRITPITPRRTLISIRRTSPQAVMALVAMLAVAVGVLAVVATGGRWILPPETVVTDAGASEVQWDHGIDGQPGVLAPPAPPAVAPVVETAGQSAEAEPSAQSAALPKEESTPAVITSRNASKQRPKVDLEQESGLASPGDAPSAPPTTSRSTRTPPASSSQPERAPPQPWLE